MDLNRIELIGRVGKDPEHAKENAPVKFSIATSSKYKDANGTLQDSPTQWHNIVVWGKAREIVKKYVRKGSQVFVSGSMEYQQYEKDGVKKNYSNVVMRELILLGNKGGSTTPPDSSEPAQPQSYDNGQEISIEDIPF